MLMVVVMLLVTMVMVVEMVMIVMVIVMLLTCVGEQASEPRKGGRVHTKL